MKDLFVQFVFKSISYLSLKAARRLGSAFGYCVWKIKGSSYRITLKNVRKCFPELNEQQLQTFVQNSLIETGKTLFETATVWGHSWDWLSGKILSVEGEEILRGELAKGKGLIVLAPHIGNWEVLGPYIASIFPITILYQPVEQSALNRIVINGRHKFNIDLAPTNRKGVGILLKKLLQGGAVGILPDQVPDKGSGTEPTMFFGHPAMTMTLIHSLIERTSCKVVSAFAQRVDGGFKIVFLPAELAIYSNNQSDSLRGLNASVETCVRLAPHQYQWEYSRFRSLPLHLRD